MLTQRELAEGLTHVSDRCGGCSGPGMVAMSPRKIKALYRQFPWVRGHVPGGGVERFHVVRVEREILDYKPLPLPVGEDANHDALYCEQLRLLDAEGQSVVRQVRKVTKYRKFLIGPVREKVELITFTGLVENSTVRETLEGLGEMGKRVHFILSCSHSTHTVIVYTVPKNLPLSEWIRLGFKLPEPVVPVKAPVQKVDVVDVVPAKTAKTAGVFVDMSQEALARMSPLARVVVQTTVFQPVQAVLPAKSV